MTSKPSRVSGVYGLLTLIEVQSAVHNESELACESLTGCLFGWMA